MDPSLSEVEELRVFINSFLTVDTLSSLSELKDVLNETPIYSEQWDFFKNNSKDGERCRFAILALKKFKERRLGGLIPLLDKVRDSLSPLVGEGKDGGEGT